MRLLAFGDLHLINNDLIDNAIIDCIKEKIQKDDIMVFLGDVFDNFNIGLKNTNFYEFISNLKNKIYIIMGNHDVSKGRFSFRNIKFFSDNIKIIENYYYEDIEDNRLHFYNFFRYQTDKTFVINNFVKHNILFTHCDNPFIFKQFDLVVNGHNHDFQQEKNIINLGAVRQVVSNETTLKKYLVLDLDYNHITEVFFDFQSPVNIEKIFYRDLENIKQFEKPTILRVLLSGYEDKKEVKEKCDNIKNCIWFEENYKDDNVILKVIDELQNTVKFDFQNIFKNYLDFYIEKFKGEDLNKERLIELFNEIYLDESVNKDFDSENYDIKFKRIRGTNFKRFEKFDIDLSNYDNDLYLIKGKNYDEIKDNEVSSNGSGKSTIRQMFEYSLLGNDSKMKPLSYGEKSGEIILELNINNDNIILYRKYTKTINELRIEINDNEEWKDLTNTDKIKLFYEKYKIENSLQFLFLSDNGLSKYFFSSKNSEKFKIFRELFPIIQYVNLFLDQVKNKVDNVESDYRQIELKYNNYLERRKEIARDILNQYRRLQQEKKEINIKELKEKINDRYFKEKYKREDLIILKQAKKDIKDFEVKTFDYTIDELEKEIEKINDSLHEKDYLELEIKNLNKKYSLLEKELLKLDNSLQENRCFYCGNNISNKDYINNHKEKINKEMKKLAEEMFILENNLHDLSLEIDTYILLQKEYKNNIKELQEYQYQERDYNKYLNHVNKMNYQDEDIDNLLEKIEKNQELKIQNNKINKEIEIKTERLLKIDEEYKLLYDKIKQIKIKYDYKNLNIEKEYYKLWELENLKIVLTGKRLVNFEKYFINLFFGKFENIFNVFIKFLFDSNIKIVIDEMNFNFIDNENETEFNNFSQGEQTKISVALMLTNNSIFREFGIKSNLLFLDEFLDNGIDEINLERIIKLIKNFYKNQLIFLVTHKNVEELINKEIIVERKNNRSILV